MDIHAIQITQDDVDRVLAEATPAQAAGFVGDACKAYSEARPLIQVGIGILSFIYPPASTALATAVAVLDKACEKTP